MPEFKKGFDSCSWVRKGNGQFTSSNAINDPSITSFPISSKLTVTLEPIFDCT